MKKIYVCIVLLAFALAAACGLSQFHIGSDGSVSGNDVTANDVSPAEYAPSEKQNYFNQWGSGNANAIVSGNDYVENPWGSANDVSNDNTQKTSRQNSFVDVCTPTYFEYYDGLWFIVDCYHDQVIFTDDLDKPFWEWKIMDDRLNRPHTLAFDGEVYMLDDTEDKKIVAYVKHENDDGSIWFERIQEFVDMGERPHYVYYCEEEKTFYAWSSMSGQMWVFKRSRDAKKVYLDSCFNIPALNGVYVRSFFFDEDKCYFVSGTYGSCTIFETTRKTFDVIREIPVAPEIGGMVQISKIQDYYYVTSSTSIYGETDVCYVVRTDSLDHLLMGQFEDLTPILVGDEFPGAPYNITEIDGEYYLVLHRDYGPPISHFKVEDNVVTFLGSYP